MASQHLDKQPLEVGKLVCVGRNYVAHIEELGNEVPEQMVLFCKPRTALTTALHATHGGEALHYEAELCFQVVDGRLDAVAIGLDLTKRQTQSYLKSKGLPWERAKAFDGSALLSCFVPYESGVALEFSLHIDGQLVQYGHEQLMIHSPARILDEIHAFMRLEDGDVIMSGTPAGVGIVAPGAKFEAEVRQGSCTLLRHEWVVCA